MNFFYFARPFGKNTQFFCKENFDYDRLPHPLEFLKEKTFPYNTNASIFSYKLFFSLFVLIRNRIFIPISIQTICICHTLIGTSRATPAIRHNYILGVKNDLQDHLVELRPGWAVSTVKLNHCPVLKEKIRGAFRAVFCRNPMQDAGKARVHLVRDCDLKETPSCVTSTTSNVQRRTWLPPTGGKVSRRKRESDPASKENSTSVPAS